MYRYHLTFRSHDEIFEGVAAHANTYKLTSSTRNNFYDVAAGPGPAGEFTGREGFLAYFEVHHIDSISFVYIFI